MNAKGDPYRRRSLPLAVLSVLLACAGVIEAQSERRAPEASLQAGTEIEFPFPSKNNYPPQCPSQEILAGKNDDFVTTDGVEAAAPSAALQAWVSGGPLADFDGTATNVRFVHTFRIPPCKCLVGAKLEFSAKALGSSGQFSSGNDVLTLGFSSLSGVPRWSAYFGSGNNPNVPWLSSTAWGSSSLPTTFTLDLAALSTAGGAPYLGPPTTSLLSAMQTNRYLDFYVQDDTAIDYIKLTVTMCDCCQTTGKAEICITKFYDRNRNGVKDSNETLLAGWAFQAKDQAGGNIVTSPKTNADGRICFGVAAPATYTITEVAQPPWIQTTPTNPTSPVVTVTPGGPVVDLVFGNWRKKGPPFDPDEKGDPNSN